MGTPQERQIRPVFANTEIFGAVFRRIHSQKGEIHAPKFVLGGPPNSYSTSLARQRMCWRARSPNRRAKPAIGWFPSTQIALDPARSGSFRSPWSHARASKTYKKMAQKIDFCRLSLSPLLFEHTLPAARKVRGSSSSGTGLPQAFTRPPVRGRRRSHPTQPGRLGTERRHVAWLR